MGVARFGLQMGATLIYTYTTDCDKFHAAEIGAVINLFKSGTFGRITMEATILTTHF